MKNHNLTIRHKMLSFSNTICAAQMSARPRSSNLFYEKLYTYVSPKVSAARPLYPSYRLFAVMYWIACYKNYFCSGVSGLQITNCLWWNFRWRITNIKLLCPVRCYKFIIWTELDIPSVIIVSLCSGTQIRYTLKPKLTVFSFLW